MPRTSRLASIFAVFSLVSTTGCADFLSLPGSQQAPRSANTQNPQVSAVVNSPIKATIRNLVVESYFVVADSLNPGTPVYLTRTGAFHWRKTTTVNGNPLYHLANEQGLYVLRAQDLKVNQNTGVLEVKPIEASDPNYPPGLILSKSAPGPRDGQFADASQTIPGRIYGLLGEVAKQGDLTDVPDSQLQQYFNVGADHDSDLAIAKVPTDLLLKPTTYGADVKAWPQWQMPHMGIVIDSLRGWFSREGAEGPQVRPYVDKVLTYIDLLGPRPQELPVRGKGFIVLSRNPSPANLSELLFTQTASLNFALEYSHDIFMASLDLHKLGPSSTIGALRLSNQDGLYIMGCSGTYEPSQSPSTPGMPRISLSNLDAQLPSGDSLESVASSPENGGLGFKVLQYPLIADSTRNYGLNRGLLNPFAVAPNGMIVLNAAALPDTTSEFEERGSVSLGPLPGPIDYQQGKGRIVGVQTCNKYIALMRFENPDGLVRNADGTFSWASPAGRASLGLPGE